jgi:hypothetical protein
VPVLDSALRSHGWTVYSTFENGSPFGHAQTYAHDVWGYLDLHRLFPGIGLDPAIAFERFWLDRTTIEFGGLPCPVPSVPAQAAILVLNAARGAGHRSSDLTPTWYNASPGDRKRLQYEIDALDAHIAFDAVLGRLDIHRGSREYRLWRAVSEGGGRIEEWWGRVLAAPTLPARVGVIVRAARVNIERLAHRLGRAPTRFEVAREFVARPVRGIAELRRRWWGRHRNR